ncbi:MAG: malonyl-ACP O-methyltransferase BioC [Gammaproteobacteria bacterium]
MPTSFPDAYRLDKKRLAAAFNRAAPSYDRHAVLQQTVAMRMLERLALVKIAPRRVLDAGAGTGYAARLLHRAYRPEVLVAFDIAHGMLRQARAHTPRFFSRHAHLCGDVERLPLAAGSIELAFSNLALQWCNDLDRALEEFRRVLTTQGILMFSTFGPDTLSELRSSWATVDSRVHVHVFADMHDIGDALIRAGFSGPVLDVERFTMTYRDAYALMRDLKTIGAVNAAQGRHRGLTGKGGLTALVKEYERFRCHGVLPATFEVVYGHAWVPEAGARPQDGSTVAAFPVEQLRSAIKGRLAH